MGYKVAPGYCNACGESVALHQERPNHLFHLLLTVITGLWAVVWFVLSIKNTPWRCAKCESADTTFRVPAGDRSRATQVSPLR